MKEPGTGLAAGSPTPASAAARRGYFPTLDGWRALAVLVVILYHGREAFFAPGSALMAWAHQGYLGVDVFFAISGFLICSRLLQEQELKGQINLRGFYIRRAFRILPPYLLTIFGICLLGILGYIHIYRWGILSSLAFIRDYFPAWEKPGDGPYTRHFWSLAVEEHFYMLWPLVLFKLRAHRAAKFAAIAILIVGAWRMIDGHFELLSGLLPEVPMNNRTDARLDALLAGCLAAIFYGRLRQWFRASYWGYAWAPLLLILVGAVYYDVPFLRFGLIFLFPALILSTVIHPHTFFSRFLEWKPMRWIGTLSYSLYLWQQIFMQPLPAPGSIEVRSGFVLWQSYPWNVVALLALACASYYLLERPMIRLGHRIATPPIEGRPELQTAYGGNYALQV